MTVDLNVFRQRLAETIAWCTPRASFGDVVYSLRTPSLCPTGFEFRHNEHGDYRGFEPSLFGEEPSGLQSMVGILAAKRAELLRQDSGYDSQSIDGLANGRLLACQLYCTLFDGASEAESKGFVDVDDVPPWDTWLWLGALETKEREQYACPQYDYHLISWVPAPFVDLVEQGIWANALDILKWAENIDSAVTDQLRDAKVLQ